MTKKYTKIKNKILAGTVAVLMGTSLGVACNATLANSAKRTFAYQSNVSVSNSNFSSTSSGTPAIPTGWTGIENYANTTSGIVNLATTSQTTINDDYNLQSLPYAKDASETTKNVLMINANNGAYFAGYQTNDDITFEKQSYYRISVEAFTFAGTQTNGSFGLTGNEKIQNLNAATLEINGTNGTWNTYSIYLATGQFDSLALKINLLLGQRQRACEGAIFFDNISITRFDKEEFYGKNPSNTAFSTFVDLTNEGNVDGFLTNADFENGRDGWSICENVSSGKSIDAGVFAIGAGFDLTNVENPNAKTTPTSHALLIKNNESAHYGLKSSNFVISQYGIYKLSIWAKANADANATAKLIKAEDDTEYEITDIKQVSNEFTNGWKEYSFFVKGSPFSDQEMNLELWLGSEASDSAGYVWFDNITLTKITTEQFDAESSNGKAVDLYAATSSLDFANGNFNIFKVENLEQNYPFSAQNWTVENNSALTKVGILNTSKTVENQIVLGSDLPLLENRANNNVLMILNNDFKKQTATSETATLDADSYYQINIYALANTNGNASIALLADDVVISEQNQIATSGWTKYTFFIKTGFESKSISIQLGLGRDVACTGYACFDSVIMEKIADSDAFDAKIQNKTSNSKVVDLSQIDFSNVGLQIEDNIFASNDFAGTLKDGISATYIAGVDTDTNTLVIKSLNDEIYYSFESNMQYSLSQNNYYQFDIKLKTTGIIQDDNKTKGAKISLNGIDASFKQIDTENEEKTYTIFVKCTEDKSVSVIISLGDSSALTQGSLAVSNISIKKIDSEAYQQGIQVLEKSNAPDNVLAIGNTDSEKKSDEEESKTSSGIEFNFLYASTIITGLAIIIAVVGVMIRQYKRKHKRKVNVKRQIAKDAEQSAKDIHKEDLRTINAQLAKLNEKQTKLAEEINALNAEDADANKEKVDELTEKYNLNKQKIEKLVEQKKDKNKQYRKKMSQMKQDQKAEKELTKKRK